MHKAYYVHGLDVSAVIFTDGGRGRAKMKACLAARDAGYKCGPQHFRAVRVKRFDGVVDKYPHNVLLSFEVVDGNNSNM